MKDQVLFPLDKLHWEVQDKIFPFIDPEFPNWISTNEVGAKIIWKCDGHNTIGGIVSEISRDYGVSLDRVMDDMKIFVEMAKEKGFLKTILSRGGHQYHSKAVKKLLVPLRTRP